MTPALVGWIIVHYGRRAPFVSFGSLGVIWSIVWFGYYRDHPAEHKGVNAAELELIAPVAGRRKSVIGAVPWRTILSGSQMWILSAAYFCYGYSLAVYLDWFPKYLNAERGFSIEKMGFHASLPLLAGTFGDIAGGWFSDILARRIALARARKGATWAARFRPRSRAISSSTMAGIPRSL